MLGNRGEETEDSQGDKIQSENQGAVNMALPSVQSSFYNNIPEFCDAKPKANQRQAGAKLHPTAQAFVRPGAEDTTTSEPRVVFRCGLAYDILKVDGRVFSAKSRPRMRPWRNSAPRLLPTREGAKLKAVTS